MSALILGIIIGWILEWIMDRRFWRKERESAMRRDHSEAQALQRQLDEERKRHKSELKELQRQEREHQTRYDEQGKRIADIEEQIGQLKLERDRAVTERDQLNGKSNSEVNSLKGRIAELSAQRDDAIAEVSELRVRIETQEAEQARSREQLAGVKISTAAAPVSDQSTPATEPSPKSEKPTAPAAAAIGSEPDRLVAIRGIGPVFAKRLEAAGINSFEQVANQEPAHLCEVTGLRASQAALAESWIEQAEQLIGKDG